MALWRVDVCGVSHRFVEAESRAEAEEAVRRALLEAMDIRASDAGRYLGRAFEDAGPLQRKRMLARLDGLTNPRERRSSTSAQRRLERDAARARAEDEWASQSLGSAPPVSPETLDSIVRLMEVQRIEVEHLRLQEWDRKSPVHGRTL